MKQSILVIFCVMFLVSCKKLLQDDLSNEKDKYKIVLQNKIDTVYNVKGNTLYIFFETDFNKDLLKVKFKDKMKKYLITTDRSTGYADFIDLGELSNFGGIEFSINEGKSIVLDNVHTNLIKVNYFKDSIVNISFSNNPKAYE